MKKLAPILITVIIAGYLFINVLVIRKGFAEVKSFSGRAYIVLFVAIFLGLILALIANLIERLKEIDKEDDDDLSKY